MSIPGWSTSDRAFEVLESKALHHWGCARAGLNAGCRTCEGSSFKGIVYFASPQLTSPHALCHCLSAMQLGTCCTTPLIDVAMLPQKPAPVELGVVMEKMKDHGVLMGKGGLHGNVFRVKPPMCFTKADADFLVDVMDHCMSEL